MSPILLVLSGIFVGAFFGVIFVALLQASRTQISFRENRRRVKKGEEAMDALDPVLSAMRIKECL
jgi:hypothetical protein